MVFEGFYVNQFGLRDRPKPINERETLAVRSDIIQHSLFRSHDLSGVA